MFIEKSIKEIDNFIKKLSNENISSQISKQIQTIDITKIFYNLLKNRYYNELEEFQILNNLYNSFDPKINLYTFIDNNIIVSPESLEEHLKSGKNYLLERNINISIYGEYIENYYSEIDFNNVNQCCKYYIYDLIIQKYNFLKSIGLNIKNISIELKDFFEEKSTVSFTIKLTNNDFKKLIDKKINLYKTLIEKSEYGTFNIIKNQIKNYINLLDETQGKNGKGIILEKTGEFNYDTLLKICLILVFENYISIKNFNIFSSIFEIDLLNNKKVKIDNLDKQKILKKLNNFLEDNKCQEFTITKDGKGNIDLIYLKKILEGYKYIDIQELYPFANITSKTHRGKSEIFIVEEKIKIGKN